MPTALPVSASVDTFMQAANQAAMQSALALVPGTNVQAYSATLAAVAGGTYTGATSITTLGTIATGVWNGTAIAVANGGTGATDAGTARTNLGLGSIATQASSAVSITGGTITGLTDFGVLMANNTAITGIALGSITDTTSRPLTISQTWNNSGLTAAMMKLVVTNTSAAAGSTAFAIESPSSTNLLSVAYNTTGGNAASPWRLVFGSDASLGYASAYSALTLRNAANSADAALRASTFYGVSWVGAGSYIAIGNNGAETDVSLSSAGWRGAGVRLSSTATVVWSQTSAASGTNDNGIYSGTGSPESSVTARVGSLYLRRDGGANTTLYVKESGTGNTGWIAK